MQKNFFTIVQYISKIKGYNREYWMIYRGSCPPPSPLLRCLLFLAGVPDVACFPIIVNIPYADGVSNSTDSSVPAVVGFPWCSSCLLCYCRSCYCCFSYCCCFSLGVLAVVIVSALCCCCRPNCRLYLLLLLFPMFLAHRCCWRPCYIVCLPAVVGSLPCSWCLCCCWLACWCQFSWWCNASAVSGDPVDAAVWYDYHPALQ